jgi:hypothetical protein
VMAGLLVRCCRSCRPRSQQLWDAFGLAYTRLGLDAACGQDEVFKALVLAQLIEPTGKLDTIRVVKEIGIVAPSYPTINRRLPVYATDEWRHQLARACGAYVGLGPATVVVYDVTTLYFETDEGPGFSEPGFSKERRLDPQITVGLLTDVHGFPLTVHAFEGNRAETKNDPAGDPGVRRHAPDPGGDRGRRRRNVVRGEPGRVAGCRAAVHHRHSDP